MPYITKEQRKNIDLLLNPLLNYLSGDGEINYAITKIISCCYKSENGYQAVNRGIGTLESVKQEYYRRIVAPYEDIKKKENGDVY